MNTRFAAYLLKRLGMALLTIFLVVAITFFTMHAIPASPFSSEKAKNDATIAALEAKYGFDKPVPVQFVNYLKNILRFDFGLSTGWVGSTVAELIQGGFAYSARIGFTAALIAIFFGVLLGSLAALRRGSWADRVIQVVTTALVSMPSFVIATLLLLIFGLYLRWAPTLGSKPGGLVLPVLSLSLYPMAYITRLERSSMLDVLGQDYIRTARQGRGRAQGGVQARPEECSRARYHLCRPHDGLYPHRLNGGREHILRARPWPPVCQQHAQNRLHDDHGGHHLLAVMIILMNLLSDILYKVMDPRIDLR